MRIYVLILVVVVLLRLVAYLAFRDASYTLDTDPGAYRDLAANLLAGKGLVTTSEWGTFRAIYPPLYPILLACFGPWLNPLIDAGVAYTLYVLGGKKAAALYVLWPIPILLVATPQKETLAILLVTQIALAIVRLRREHTHLEIVRLGIASGLLGLTQPAFFTFAPIAVLLLNRDRRSIVWGSLVAVLVLTPWWVRNWLVFETFVPLTTAPGYNLIASVTGQYTLNKGFAVNLGELEGSRAAFQTALRLIVENPIDPLLHKAKSVAKAFAMDGYELNRLVRPFFPLCEIYWVAVVFMAAVKFRLVSAELKLLFLAAAIQLVVFNVWFEFGERHRYLLVPFVFIAAAWPRLKEYSRKPGELVRKC